MIESAFQRGSAIKDIPLEEVLAGVEIEPERENNREGFIIRSPERMLIKAIAMHFPEEHSVIPRSCFGEGYNEITLVFPDPEELIEYGGEDYAKPIMEAMQLIRKAAHPNAPEASREGDFPLTQQSVEKELQLA